MRLSVLAYGLGALGLAGLVFVTDPAAAAKSKMGCVRGKQIWDASAGKCVAGKYKMRAAKRVAKKGPAAKK